MAEQSPPIHFEDIPLDEAHRMGRGPRMDPALYQAFKEKIQSLGNTATRLTLPEGTSSTTRRVPGGLLFWCSTDEDLQQAKEVAGRLRTARSKGQSRISRRRRA